MQTRAALGRIEAGDLAGAARILDALVALHPDLGLLHANRAALYMLQDAPASALDSLEAAAGRGFDGFADLAADPLFAGLAADPRLAALIAAQTDNSAQTGPAAPPATPITPATPVTNGEALVSGGNTAWNPGAERLEPRFSFPESTSRSAPRWCPTGRPPPPTSCANIMPGAAPPAIGAISTTTATAAIPASIRRRIRS